jgi:peptide/nickel transport system substrate-binding protein
VQEIRYQEGAPVQTAVQQVMADQGPDANAVVLGSAPPAQQQQIAASEGLRARSIAPLSQDVDYLVPAASSRVLRTEKARQALAFATNRSAYITALGGPGSAVPAYSLLPAAVPGHRDSSALETGENGSPARARDLLRESKAALPAKITVAYRSSPTADKAMAALASGWEAAGFAVTLRPIEQDYFETIASPKKAAGIDLFWANWSPAWASGSTVIPPLFDSGLNLTGDSSGRDYGRFSDATVDAAITRIGTIASRDERGRAWGELDASLEKRGAVIPLAQRRSLYLAGSNVTGLTGSETLGGVPDFARIGLR